MATTLVLKRKADTQDFEMHYVFDVMQADEVKIAADMTDHYVEDNTTIQDHVGLKPLEITLKGLVGEKIYKHEDLFSSRGSRVISKLNPIFSFIPPISSYAETVVGAASYIESSVRRYVGNAKDIAGIFNKNKTNQSRQEQVCNTLKAARDSRALVKIYSVNLGKFENYLIQNAHIVQEDNIYQSELVVELKEFRNVKTITTKINSEKYAGRIQQQKQAEADLGKMQGLKENTSTLYRWTYGAWEGGR